MLNENKRQKLRSELVKTIKREQTRNYIILYSVTLIILIVLILYSFSRGYFSSSEFIVNIVNNIIGIIPPLLIFDFFNEKLSRDASAIEMSNNITETLMSNPETLELFTDEQRRNFIHSTVQSIVKDDDTTEMINSNLQSYLSFDTNYKIRTEFDYNFELNEKLPLSYDCLKGKDDYFYMQQKLHYKVKYLSDTSNNMNSNNINIGFVFDNKNLDNVLREKKKDTDFDKCIFREILDINSIDIDYFKSLSLDKEELIKHLQKLFKLDLQIDTYKGVLDNIIIKDCGIIFQFHVNHDVNAKEHAVRIIFHMPKRWGAILEVALVDPTKAPKISVSYPEDTMSVDMFSFLSKGDESSLEVAHEHMNGVYDIVINNEWIYPISGMVFYVTKISE